MRWVPAEVPHIHFKSHALVREQCEAKSAMQVSNVPLQCAA